MTLEYKKAGRYFAAVGTELEALGAEELTALGASRTEPVFRGVHFQADPESFYRIHYQSRLFTRILAPLVRFPFRREDDLYDAARSVPWETIFSLEDTFLVASNVNERTVRNSAFAAVRVKDGIVDRFRDRTGRRPSVDRREPGVRIDLHVDRGEGTISLETSGGSLHRRGYRRETVEAPIQETLAAAILRIAEWDGGTPLVDPMCGSGTFLCEALLQVTATPAGFLRDRFGFVHLPDFDRELWKRVKRECDAAIDRTPAARITGSDEDGRALRAAQRNLDLLPGGDRVTLERSRFQDLKELHGVTLVTNPPYGLRLRPNEDLHGFYKELGDFFKQRCSGSVAYVYFGDRKWLKSIGLRPTWKKPLANGGLDGRLARFELY